MAKCNRCGAPITFVLTAKSGAKTPIDPTPVEDGNIILTAGGSVVVSKDEAARHWAEGTSLFRSHFASCPKAANRTRRR